jgi:hypothetical protein
MKLNVPLAVRVATARADRHVTAQVRDLTFGWTDPGGFASCRIGLDRPLSIQPDDIAYYGRVTVYDGRSGATVWDGRMEDPGRTAGSSGQVWDITAIGGQTHTQDCTLPLIYVDRAVTAWTRLPGTNLALDTDQSRIEDGAQPGWRLLARQGSTFGVANHGGVEYLPIAIAGQKLARLTYTFVAGAASSSWRIQLHASNGGTATVVNSAWSTTPASESRVVVTDWPDGRTTPLLAVARTGTGTTVGDGTAWVLVTGIRVVAMRFDKAGNELDSGYSTDTVLASQVVEDLLGRVLDQYDGANATVATTSYAIQQLAYPNGITPEKVLSDLMGLESGHTWRVWERNSAGLYRFEWTTTPSTVRYEADLLDGIEAPGSVDGLYNAVTVRYRDAGDRVRTLVRTTTVPDLDDAGITRQGYIDLGDEVGSQSDAERAGDQWLAQRRYPPNAGRLKIARRILDRQTGRMVDPWEIRPGLIRVRGILPRVDALNATARDGVTVFRIVGSEFRASDATATLSLDSYPYSVAGALAQLQTARPRKR